MSKPSEISPRAGKHHDSFISVDESGVHIHHEEGHQHKMEGPMGSEHTVELEESVAFATHINNVLKDDPVVKRHLPLNPQSDDLFDKLTDGLILIELVNLSVPGTIDMKLVNKGQKLNVYKIQENLNLAIKGAQKIGCHTVNIGSNDIIEKK
jgi:plastin-1